MTNPSWPGWRHVRDNAHIRYLYLKDAVVHFSLDLSAIRGERWNVAVARLVSISGSRLDYETLVAYYSGVLPRP